GSSKGSVKVPTEYERVAATPKFKQHKVSAVRDFPPGVEGGLHQTSNYIGKSQSINLVKASRS
ncbi:hypothetical protein J1N35_021983, partial [Gossypium stocksii]